MPAHFFWYHVKDYSVKDLTKIYKGPEVLMNCPSLGLEPRGVFFECVEDGVDSRVVDGDLDSVES